MSTARQHHPTSGTKRVKSTALKMLCLGFTVSLLLCVCVQGSVLKLPSEELYRLDIIHFNDFHVRFEETSVSSPTCRSNNGSCLGGFPRLYHEVYELLREKPHAVLLNAGDSFQGTYWYTLFKWSLVQQFMNLLPHDAHALGNHEFDDGPEGLAPYLRGLKAPVVAANMDVSNEKTLQGLFVPSIVVKRKQRKIGIIGLTTQETKDLSSPGGVVFTPPHEAMQREALALTSQGVDLIVVLSHCGLEIDKELASKYGHNVDIIIGGHTHSLLWNGPAPSGESVKGPYPLILQPTGDTGHNVLVVQASAFTKYMGNLSVYFDEKGEYVRWDGGPIFLDRSISEDAEMKARLAPFAQRVREAESLVVGAATHPLPWEGCGGGECALGNFVTDAFNDVAKEKVKSQYPHISLTQRGNLGSTIPAGNITKVVLFELVPYNDRVVTSTLRGAGVRSALERGAAGALNRPFDAPHLLQVSGLKVTYNMSKPELSRVVLVDVGGSPLQDDSFYQVTVPYFLYTGGDGFTMFNEGQGMKVLGHDFHLLESYLMKHSPLDVKLEGRITILH